MSNPFSSIKRRRRGLVWLAAVLLWLALAPGHTPPANAALNPGQVSEYELKAAFIYNFLKFTQWPKELDKQEKILVGVFDPEIYAICGQALRNKPLEKKKLDVVQLSVNVFKEEPDPKLIQQLQACQIIYVTEGLKLDMKALTKLTAGRPIMPIGEEKNFLEQGGMINFLIVDKKIRFEINLIEAAKARIEFRSQLLRLAIRVIEPKKED